MRRQPTEPEKFLWRYLSNSELGGFKFRRQAALAPFIVDFLCPAKALVVEIDGDTHEAAADSRRDALLRKRGFTTMRFTNEDVLSNMEGVLTCILLQLQKLRDRQQWRRDSPTPNPSPEGQGLQG